MEQKVQEKNRSPRQVGSLSTTDPTGSELTCEMEIKLGALIRQVDSIAVKLPKVGGVVPSDEISMSYDCQKNVKRSCQTTPQL